MCQLAKVPRPLLGGRGTAAWHNDEYLMTKENQMTKHEDLCRPSFVIGIWSCLSHSSLVISHSSGAGWRSAHRRVSFRFSLPFASARMIRRLWILAAVLSSSLLLVRPAAAEWKPKQAALMTRWAKDVD